MEFLDEYESKPRFLFQSKHLSHPSGAALNPSSFSSFLTSLHKPTLLISLYFRRRFHSSVPLLQFRALQIPPVMARVFPTHRPPRPSPPHRRLRVGLGPPLKEIPENLTEGNEVFSRKSIRAAKKKSDVNLQTPTGIDDGFVSDFPEKDQSNRCNRVSNESKSEQEEEEEQSEWSEIDEELLRKLMGKHPVGMPGRWDAIAEGFKGKHKVETVITNAKQVGVRKAGDQDSYEKFLRSRKPVEKRVVLDEGGNEMNGEIGILNQNESQWSSAEDLALLNALKAFTNDVGMRWEKIAASVPGKTKSACMKRVTELKKGFWSSKALSGSAQS
ncbi:hypothetical protein OROHE_015988 [Orobanche hederae]